MPRKKSWVWSHFSKKQGKAYCDYCKRLYQSKNSSHLKKHLLETCTLIPAELRRNLKQKDYSHGHKHPKYGVVGNPHNKESSSDEEQSSDESETSNIGSITASTGFERSLRVTTPTSSAASSSSSSQQFQYSGVKPSTSQTSEATKFKKHNPILDLHKKNEKENEEISILLARAIYATGAPLSLVENVHWQQLFKRMKSSYVLPSRYDISNKFLKLEFERTQNLIKNKIDEAKAIVVQLDGWSNIRREPIVNAVVTTPHPVFLKSIPTQENSHTGEYMAELSTQVIEQVGVDKVVGIVTDSASNMKKCKSILEKKFNICSWPCAAHILHNLLKNICSIQVFKEILSDVKSLVGEVNNKLLKVIFKQIQLKLHPDKSPRALKQPSETRFGGNVILLDCVYSTRDSLLELARYQHPTSNMIKLSDDAVSFLSKRGIWSLIDKLLLLTKPILLWILRLEGDSGMMSEVIEAFQCIQTNCQQIIPTLSLSDEDSKKLTNFIINRRREAITPLHMLCNILDQRYCGKNLTKNEIHVATEFLLQYCKRNSKYADRRNKIIVDLAMCLYKSGQFQDADVWMSGKDLWPHIWWPTFHITSELCDVAIEFSQLTPTSCATERVNSTYEATHTKKRNKLTESRASQITFIRHNLKLLEAVPKFSLPPPAEMPDFSALHVELTDRSIEEDEAESIVEIEEEEEEPVEELNVDDDNHCNTKDDLSFAEACNMLLENPQDFIHAFA